MHKMDTTAYFIMNTAYQRTKTHPCSEPHLVYHFVLGEHNLNKTKLSMFSVPQSNGCSAEGVAPCIK